MMKPLLFLAASCLCLSVKAININTSSVSGHWTLSGSPYKVFNNIQIQSCDSLVIDPGVEVIFQGYYSLDVFGILKASGNSSGHILFHAKDTTGWANPMDTSGAWKGISWSPYTCTATDHSAFKYCDI